jgi:hypothetical protein
VLQVLWIRETPRGKESPLARRWGTSGAPTTRIAAGDLRAVWLPEGRAERRPERALPFRCAMGGGEYVTSRKRVTVVPARGASAYVERTQQATRGPR